MASTTDKTPAAENPKEKEEEVLEETSDEEEFDDYAVFDEEDDDEDEDELGETLTSLFTTEDGVNMAEVGQEMSDHLENITKLLSNQNKILLKLLQKI